jgi:hypothetical protein
MTIYTLERAETQQLPAARCTFQQRVSESGKKWVDVTMLHLTSTGWGGRYTVSHAAFLAGGLPPEPHPIPASLTPTREP